MGAHLIKVRVFAEHLVEPVDHGVLVRRRGDEVVVVGHGRVYCRSRTPETDILELAVRSRPRCDDVDGRLGLGLTVLK